MTQGRFPWMFSKSGMNGVDRRESNNNMALSYYSGRFDLAGLIKEIGIEEVEKVIEKVKNGSL